MPYLQVTCLLLGLEDVLEPILGQVYSVQCPYLEVIGFLPCLEDVLEPILKGSFILFYVLP
jgi:hypothetical protein